MGSNLLIFMSMPTEMPDSLLPGETQIPNDHAYMY